MYPKPSRPFLFLVLASAHPYSFVSSFNLSPFYPNLLPTLSSSSSSSSSFIRTLTTHRSFPSSTKMESLSISADTIDTPTVLPDVPLNSETITEIQSNLSTILAKIQSEVSSTPSRSNIPCKLIAVSKTKPLSALLACRSVGHLTFGENYVQETISKIPGLPNDAIVHFIGPLQSNKAASLVKGCGLKLHCVESVNTLKIAKKLSDAVKVTTDRCNDDGSYVKLNVYIQIDTSLEDTKSGIPYNDPAQLNELINMIAKECESALIFKGLMTIGAPNDMTAFTKLRELKEQLEKEGLGKDLELSMGMSGDYLEAIRQGATSVRVGSSIFGARDYSK